MRIFKRNPLLSKGKFIQSILIALFIGCIYWRLPGPDSNPTERDNIDKEGFLFFFMIGMFMMSLNPSIITFPS